MNRPSKIALLALVIAPLCVTAALADPTTLICDTGSEGPQIHDLGPGMIVLNEGEGTATVTFPAYQFPTTGVTNPAETDGPVHAIFDANTITFAAQVRGSLTKFEMNRLSGTVVLSFPSASAPGAYTPPWTCQPGKKQF